MATPVGPGAAQGGVSSAVLSLTLFCRYSYQKHYGQLHDDPVRGPHAQLHHEGAEHRAGHRSPERPHVPAHPLQEKRNHGCTR